MTDSELMEFAAKAHGNLRFVQRRGWFHVMRDNSVGAQWDPLNDDGDALRLAVRMGRYVRDYFSIEIMDTCCQCMKFEPEEIAYEEFNGADPGPAVRRSVVRAAALIGQEMP